MKTLIENTRAVGSSAYFGERPDWLIASAITRDSDCLERSNFRSMEKALKEYGEAIEIERFSHWAVGWCDYLIINPSCAEAVTLAESIRAKLDDYPVIDDDDFSALEMEEANEVWKNCYRPTERIQYIRKHSSQFEFRSFADLLSNVRGNYFSGYASELISR